MSWDQGFLYSFVVFQSLEKIFNFMAIFFLIYTFKNETFQNFPIFFCFHSTKIRPKERKSTWDMQIFNCNSGEKQF
jgi:hypothetical protein